MFIFFLKSNFFLEKENYLIKHLNLIIQKIYLQFQNDLKKNLDQFG